MERTEESIRAELKERLALYHEYSTNERVPPSKLRELDAEIRKLRTDLSSLLADGAKDCPRCGHRPIGHLKRFVEAQRAVIPPSREGASPTSKDIPEERVYEIMCVVCELRSRGETIRAATLLWNAGEYVKTLDDHLKVKANDPNSGTAKAGS